MDARSRFEALVPEFTDRPGVTPPQGGRSFGSSGLKVNGSIFAMVDVWGRLVVKLPSERVSALVSDGTGAPFDNGKGRVMKQWVVVVDPVLDRELVEEALAFVGGAAAGG